MNVKLWTTVLVYAAIMIGGTVGMIIAALSR